jgi:ribosome-associated heat shock protein Hsp15
MESSISGQLRIDKLLWYLRFAKSRSIAQAMVEAGHIRLEGRRINRSSALVQAGQHLVIPFGDRVDVIRIITLPTRRGPAPEAQACYELVERMISAPLAH